MCRLYFLESTQEGKGEVFDTNDKTKALTINNSTCTCKSTKDVNSNEKKHFTHFETETKKVKTSEILALWRSLADTKSLIILLTRE